MTDDQRTAVVIPCRDERATLAACIASVRAQDPQPTWVVVVDNGSVDGSREIGRARADVLIERAGGTIAASRNAGVAAVPDAELIAFLDADCEAAAGWLAAGLTALETADLAGHRVEAPPSASWVARHWSAVELQLTRAGAAVWSANMVVRREAFDAVGGFAAHLRTNEDVDLCRRLLAAGCGVTAVPAMRVRHHGFPGTLAGFVRRERWHASTPGWFWATSPRTRGLLAAASAWAVTCLLAVGRSGGRRGRVLLGLAAATAGGIAVLGRAAGGGAGPGGVTTSAARGILVATWAVARLSRLPRGLRRPPLPRGGPGAA
jgi:GT2 family glycosyltransferase